MEYKHAVHVLGWKSRETRLRNKMYYSKEGITFASTEHIIGAN